MWLKASSQFPLCFIVIGLNMFVEVLKGFLGSSQVYLQEFELLVVILTINVGYILKVTHPFVPASFASKSVREDYGFHSHCYSNRESTNILPTAPVLTVFCYSLDSLRLLVQEDNIIISITKYRTLIENTNRTKNNKTRVRALDNKNVQTQYDQV